VLDLSRILAGPWTTQILADLGAEVIKVERPGRGDDTRGWAPPFLRGADENDTVEPAYFLCANRGKKSVTIDITRAGGQAMVRRLAERSDVLTGLYAVLAALAHRERAAARMSPGGDGLLGSRRAGGGGEP
jgi:crotonobetainyl-CoA:carnitine CoA-transferase CaiB-like acyl-CoA transferase